VYCFSLGQREYDWTKKGTFLLDPTECGEIIALDPARGADFIHDPNVGMEKAGQVMKRLKIAASPDGKGLFVTLTVRKEYPYYKLQSCRSML
jgi:hypothetical protein